MALEDLTAGLLLDGASGLVLIAFGALAALVHPRRPTLVAFAVFAVAFGIRQVNENIVRILVDAPARAYVSDLAYLGAAFGIAWFALAYLGGPSALRAGDLAVAAAIATAPAALALSVILPLGIPVWEARSVLANLVTTGAFHGVLALLALAAARNADPGRARLHAAVALALVWWPALDIGDRAGGIVDTSAVHGPLGLLAVAAAVSLLWTRAIPNAGRMALAVALAIPLLVIVGQLLAYNQAQDSGVYGVARTLSVVLLAFTFARSGLLEGRLALRRGTIVTTLLAIMLVVAQVAQNFLSAQYGLLMGGVVAGALLVAARPIERALEGRSSDRIASSAPARSPRAAEESYLLALRLALRDRVLTREEEHGLVVLAHDLGIPPRRAHELLLAVEREVGTKEAQP